MYENIVRGLKWIYKSKIKKFKIQNLIKLQLSLEKNDNKTFLIQKNFLLRIVNVKLRVNILINKA